MAKVVKLNEKQLRDIVLSEAKKYAKTTTDAAKNTKEIKKMGDMATLENQVDFLKALNIEEARLVDALKNVRAKKSKLKEAKKAVSTKKK